MADLTIEMRGADEVRAAFERAPAMIEREMRATMDVAVSQIERVVVENTPVGATGLARAGVTTDVRGSAVDLTGRVFNRDNPIKIASIETGRKPGRMPPIGAIELWVRRKFGGDRQAAFMIARAIGKRGTKGARMFEKAYQSEAPKVKRLFERRLSAIIDKVLR